MVIELLSPENKHGKGQEEYQRKQQAVLQSQAHLLEIDLLRGGEHTVAAPREGALALGSYSYLLSLANAQEPSKILLWRIGGKKQAMNFPIFWFKSLIDRVQKLLN